MSNKKIIIIVTLSGGMFFILLLVVLGVAVFPVGRHSVALVEINGPIYNSQNVIEQLHRHRDNPLVRAIVLRINSPGGAVAPVQEIHRELSKIDKKIVVSMGSTAASGAYYIACEADCIFANQGTLTGSIGVIMSFYKLGGLMNKLGVEQEVIKSGEYKDAGSMHRSLTPEERELFEETIDDVHDQFVEAIVEGRQHKELTREQVEEIADGRLLSGRQALERNLVDQMGDLNDAIEYAAELAGITGKPRVIKIEERKSLLEKFGRRFLGGKLEQITHDQAPLRYELPL